MAAFCSVVRGKRRRICKVDKHAMYTHPAGMMRVVPAPSLAAADAPFNEAPFSEAPF